MIKCVVLILIMISDYIHKNSQTDGGTVYSCVKELVVSTTSRILTPVNLVYNVSRSCDYFNLFDCSDYFSISPKDSTSHRISSFQNCIYYFKTVHQDDFVHGKTPYKKEFVKPRLVFMRESIV